MCNIFKLVIQLGDDARGVEIGTYVDGEKGNTFSSKSKTTSREIYTI
jgi:hypothetical protein